MTAATAFLGAGIHCALGSDVASCLSALRAGPRAPQELENNITGETLKIPYKLLADEPLAAPEERLFKVISNVAEQALTQAGLTHSQRQGVGLFLGSSSFNICAMEARYQAELADSPETALALRDSGIGSLAYRVMTDLGLRGSDFSFNTACTASANALVAAVSQVEAGLLDYALVLGVELYNEVSALGFASLGLLTSSVMKPFDAERDGLVLGEGVAAVLVGRSAGDDGFYLRGAASISDIFSITASNPDGSAIARVMQDALRDAQIEASDVTALKVHGTASLSNDEAESAGMHTVFEQLPPICALKPYLGHTLGACGLIELIIFYSAMQDGFLIGTPGISEKAGELGVSLNQQALPMERGNFMLNYFGFGGNNTSLLISNDLRG
jgi:3-oxoacyl-(acyl-carrier-protein) synthase